MPPLRRGSKTELPSPGTESSVDSQPCSHSSMLPFHQSNIEAPRGYRIQHFPQLVPDDIADVFPGIAGWGSRPRFKQPILYQYAIHSVAARPSLAHHDESDPIGRGDRLGGTIPVIGPVISRPPPDLGTKSFCAHSRESIVPFRTSPSDAQWISVYGHIGHFLRSFSC